MIRLITLGLFAIGCRAGQNYDDVYDDDDDYGDD